MSVIYATMVEYWNFKAQQTDGSRRTLKKMQEYVAYLCVMSLIVYVYINTLIANEAPN